MPIYRGATEQKLYRGATELLVNRGSTSILSTAVAPDATLSRTLDRTWGQTIGSGGGNVEPDRFVYEGNNWEVWQVVPYLAGVGERQRGDCRVHFRNRDVNRGAMQLTDLPARIVLSGADWTGLPWEFTRPTANNKFTNVGSGNSARKGADYERDIPDRSITPASLGIAQGETFTLEIFW